MKRPRLKASLPARPKAAWRQALGGKSHRRGHGAEWLAAAWLMLKGYQILGFRLKTRQGEIDILARRGSILAIVEVKRRATMEAAMAALTSDQHQRLSAAGQSVRRGKPALNALTLRIDMVALAPGRFPRHLRGIAVQRPEYP